MSPWTPQSIEAACARWVEGASASVIAGELGPGFTRNSVIGLVNRRGLARRLTQTPRRLAPSPAPVLPTREPAPEPQPQSLPPPPALPPQRPPVVEPVRKGRLVGLLELREGDCKFPIGEPGKPGFGFCGCRAVPAQKGIPPYCEAHVAVAVVPRDPRRRDRAGASLWSGLNVRRAG